MFKGEYGVCGECERLSKDLGVSPPKRWIVIKKPYLCKVHNNIRKRGGKPVIKKVVKSSIKYKKKKPTGEWKMFEEIWKVRDHICTGCDKQLNDQMIPHYFSHILKKGTYPSLRLDPDNIMIECVDCHQIQDYGTIDQRKTLLNFDKKLEYILKHAPAQYLKLTGNE